MKAKAFFGTHAGTVTVHRTVTILRIALFDSLFFASKKRHRKRYLFFGAEGETRTLAPVTRPTPLAGAPRHQLEYFSVCNLPCGEQGRRLCSFVKPNGGSELPGRPPADQWEGFLSRCSIRDAAFSQLWRRRPVPGRSGKDC